MLLKLKKKLKIIKRSKPAFNCRETAQAPVDCSPKTNEKVETYNFNDDVFEENGAFAEDSNSNVKETAKQNNDNDTFMEESIIEKTAENLFCLKKKFTDNLDAVIHEFSRYPQGFVSWKFQLSLMPKLKDLGWSMIKSSYWKTKKERKISYRCLGCDFCECGYIVSPLTDEDRRKEIIKSGVISKNQFDKTGSISHRGYHNHPHPHPKKPSKQSIDVLDERIEQMPYITPKALILNDQSREGSSFLKNEPILLNTDRLGYYMKRLKQKESGDNLKLPSNNNEWSTISDFQRNHPDFILFSSVLLGSELILCSSVVQRDILYNEDFEIFYTDVTYNFLEKFYLCTSVLYCTKLQRHIPVFSGFMAHIDTDHYYTYFLHLLTLLLTKDIDLVSYVILDFSLAQKNGFLRAYAECSRRKSFPDLTSQNAKYDSIMKSLEDEGLKKVIGCEVHFKISAGRIARNGAIIDPDQESEFYNLSLKLLTVKCRNEFDLVITDLRTKYPKAKNWISFWTQTDIASMLFSSNKKGNLNPQEGLHKDYKKYFNENMDLLTALNSWYQYVMLIERDLEAVNIGIKVRYKRKKEKSKKSIRDFFPPLAYKAPEDTKTLLDATKKRETKRSKKQN